MIEQEQAIDVIPDAAGVVVDDAGVVVGGLLVASGGVIEFGGHIRTDTMGRDAAAGEEADDGENCSTDPKVGLAHHGPSQLRVNELHEILPGGVVAVKRFAWRR